MSFDTCLSIPGAPNGVERLCVGTGQVSGREVAAPTGGECSFPSLPDVLAMPFLQTLR